jgi:FemAB family protein
MHYSEYCAMHSDACVDDIGSDLPAGIAQAISRADARGILRQEDPGAYRRALAGLGYIPAEYSSASIEYQLAYQRGHGGRWWDLSLVLCHDERPCGVWPVSFSIQSGQAAITSHGLPVLPPLFTKELPGRSCKALTKDCLNLWDELCRVGEVTIRESAESFADQVQSGISEWHEQSMRRGAGVVLQHELYVNLSLGLEQIRAHFRKSYKPLISAGMKIWQVDVLTGGDSELWTEFRELHLKVAGRVTRCAESWRLQQQAIVDGDAFLIYLLDEHQRMVGGGLFDITRDEGAYSVAAYDRSLFDKPLGHVVQYRAIEEMQKRGLRWYKIGRRPYESDTPGPTEKELSIGEFKDGFATHIFPRYVLRCGSEASKLN